VVAVSADRPEALQDSRRRHGLGYELYSDSTLEAARRFGIVYQLGPDEVERYRGFGIDLEAASGQGHHRLPVPSVFLVDASGTVRWVYSNPDYKVRPANAELLEAARAAAKTGSR
jgi:peroxiredoxin